MGASRSIIRWQHLLQRVRPTSTERESLTKVRMEGWRQRRLGSEPKTRLRNNTKNFFDWNRPSHGRTCGRHVGKPRFPVNENTVLRTYLTKPELMDVWARKLIDLRQGTQSLSHTPASYLKTRGAGGIQSGGGNATCQKFGEGWTNSTPTSAGPVRLFGVETTQHSCSSPMSACFKTMFLISRYLCRQTDRCAVGADGQRTSPFGEG